MRRLLFDLRAGLLFRLEVIALLVGSVIIGMNASSLLLWLGVSEKAARGLGIVVLVTLFWMAAIWWIYMSLRRDSHRCQTDAGEAERE
ncbi:MAG: hypothetical protein MUF63_02665 [Rhodobacteraceae bacterium]|jgi:hypothetical protein|nr:hypothetical protein [Paracoccaceae bacterium]